MNSKQIIHLAKIKKQLKRAKRNVASGKKGARDVESRWQGKLEMFYVKTCNTYRG